MTQLNVRDAAFRAGVSRQTMFRYIADGRVSATQSRSGQKQIAVSELLRVFGELQSETDAKTAAATARESKRRGGDSLNTTAIQALEIERLRGQLALAEERLSIANERVSELKSRQHDQNEEKGRLLNIIERQTLLLSAPVAQQHKTAKTISTSIPVKPASVKAIRPDTAMKKTTATAAKTVKRPSAQPTKTASKSSKKVPTKAKK